MTYSRDPVEGVYISDWPALSKFFTESTISCIGLQNGNKVKQAMIHNLWKGKRPTAKELLDYLEMPIQLQLVGKHLPQVFRTSDVRELNFLCARTGC